MNKETIEKFKAEFDWWVEQEEIWEKRDGKQYAWILTDNPKFDENYIYAINDVFAEERRAYAEGKQIEIINENGWRIIENPSWCYECKYRIKPDLWYLNIPEKGRLCWVSDLIEKPESNNSIAIIISYDKKSCCKFISKMTEWAFAKPLTYEEIKQFLIKGNNEEL